MSGILLDRRLKYKKSITKKLKKMYSEMKDLDVEFKKMYARYKKKKGEEKEKIGLMLLENRNKHTKLLFETDKIDTTEVFRFIGKAVK